MKPFKTLLCILLGCSLFFAPGFQAHAAETQVTVLVLPFTIHAAADQSFLQEAVMDMLHTRLASRNLAVASVKETSPGQAAPDARTETAAVTMGREQNAGYVLLGSLTLLGESVSTDARLIRTTDSKTLLTFSRTGEGQGAVIAHVDELAAEVSNEVMQPGAQAATPPVPVAAVPAAQAPTQVELTYVKSDDFKTEIHGMTLGDVDGDGRNEIVLVDSHTVYIQRFSKGKFVPVQTITEKRYNEFYGVDAADINRNGVAEIFITNYIKSQDKMQSFVLEWDGSGFKKISDKANWYYRVVHPPSKDPVLLGQKRGIGTDILSVKDALFEKEVYELAWQNSAYRPATRLKLPPNQTVYGFVIGDVANTGQEKLVAFTESSYLTIMSLKGEKEWESDVPYGGSVQYFETQDPEYPENTNKLARFYLPQRIFLTDFDQDGQNELTVLKNKDAASFLGHTRYFNEGFIACLFYDAIGTRVKWQTRKVSSYICDYAVGDLDSDGKDDLVFATVSKQKSVLNKGVSAIIAASLVKQ